MFGAWGNPRPRRLRSGSSTPRSTPASTSSTPPTCTRRASPRRSSARRWQRPPRRRRAGHQGARRDGRGPEHERQLAPLDRPRGGEQPAPPADRLHRPVPDAPARPDHRHRRDAVALLTDLVRQGKIRAIGLVDVPGRGRSSRRSGSRSGAATSGSAASSRRTRSSPAASRRRCCPPAQQYGMGVIVWSPLTGGWLTGRYRKDADIDMTTGRARRLPHRFDPSLPGNQAQAGPRRGARSRSRPTRAAR